MQLLELWFADHIAEVCSYLCQGQTNAIHSPEKSTEVKPLNKGHLKHITELTSDR